MKLVKMRELARRLGIHIQTFQKWVQKDPDLAVWRNDRYGGSWWIKVEKFVGRQGIGLIDAYTLGDRRWIKAVDAAKIMGVSRHTMRNWCNNRPGFAKRLGRVFYIDLEDLGAAPDEVEKFFEGNSSQSAAEEEESSDL